MNKNTSNNGVIGKETTQKTKSDDNVADTASKASESVKEAVEPAKNVKAEKPIYSDGDIVMAMEANEAKRGSIVMLIPFLVYKLIWDHNWNPGGRSKGDHLSLYTEILAVGMNTLQIVSSRIDVQRLEAIFAKLIADPTNGKLIEEAAKALHGLCGFLRSIVVCKANDNDPLAFEKHWANGIPCEVVFGLSTDQEMYVAQDHDTVSRSKVAIIEQAVLMFKKSRTVRDVTLKLFDELSTHFTALSGDQKKKINEAASDGDKIKEMLKIRRGVMQNISYLAIKLPPYCLQAYVRSLNGEAGDRIKLGDAVHLNTANKKGTKANPTKKFTDLYKQKVESFGKAKAGPKPLNQKQIAEFFGMYGNDLFELIRMHLMGEANIAFDEEDVQLIDLIESNELESDQFAVARESKQKAIDAANAA